MSFALCLALTGSIQRNQLVHKYLAVAPALPFSKSVCKSQNRKCVCKSQNTNYVCRSQNSHTYN